MAGLTRTPLNFPVHRHIIFDLDGTLTDSRMGITRSVNHVLKWCGLPEVSEDTDLSWFIGPPLREGFKQLVQATDSAMVEKLVAAYRTRYSQVGLLENELYPGIAALLNDLFGRGKVLILATTKPTIYARRILGNFKLDHLFDRIVGSDLDGTRASKEELIGFAINAYGSMTSDFVMVGDRADDIIGAKRNGIDSIAVLYGYGTASELEKSDPTFVAKTVDDLRAVLLP